MAITTDDSVWKYGTLDDIGNTSTTVATDSFSVSTDLVEWTNTDDAPMASFVLEAAWTTAPTAGEVVTLHCSMRNIISTNDEGDVDSSFIPRSLGGWVVDAVGSSTTQYLHLGPVDLPNMKTQQPYLFFIFNGTSQTMNATWKIHVSPMALGPV